MFKIRISKNLGVKKDINFFQKYKTEKKGNNFFNFI